MKMLGCCTVSLLAVFLNAYHITHASEIPPPASFARFLCCLEVLRVFTQPFSCHVSLVFLVSDSQQEGDVVIGLIRTVRFAHFTFFGFASSI